MSASAAGLGAVPAGTATKSWERLAATEAAESYVRTTMVRLARRGQHRRWRGEIPTDWDRLPHIVSTEPAPQDTAGAAVDVRVLLASLSWDQRAVLVLRFFDDLSERENGDRAWLQRRHGEEQDQPGVGEITGVRCIADRGARWMTMNAS